MDVFNSYQNVSVIKWLLVILKFDNYISILIEPNQAKFITK